MPAEIDLRLLRVFATLAQVGSFTRTAALLNLTQSAISHGMRRLEEQLGCPLLYKKGKTTHLTPEGRHFLGQILRILDSLDRATESVSSRRETHAKLTVIFSTAMAQVVLAPILREFRESYPAVSIIVGLEDSPTAVSKIEEGPGRPRSCRRGQAANRAKAHPLSATVSISCSLRCIPGRKGGGHDDGPYEGAFSILPSQQRHFSEGGGFLSPPGGVRLSSYVEIPSFEIMKQLAKLGLGVALMAPWVAEKELSEGSLIMRPTPRSKIMRQWTVIHQGNRELRKPEQKTLIGLCRM